MSRPPRRSAARTTDDEPRWVRARTTGSRWWLALALAAGSVVSLVYLLTHPYPSYGSGLYLQIAESISRHGYGLPERIPLYLDGLPLAYPPLGMYLAAVVRDLTGVDPFTYSRIVPALLVVLYLVPYYGIGVEVLGSRRQAGLAAVLLATTPETLQWHLSSGGVVRGIGFLFALAGVYVGLRAFEWTRPHWIAAGAVLFGLTIVTHPVYTVFFGLSWVVLFAFRSATPRGLASGVVVASGGLLLAAPWWLTVGAAHDPGVFFAAAGTHSGLSGGISRILDAFVYPPTASVTVVYYVATYAATLVYLRSRRWFLPAWLLVAGYVVAKPRLLFVPGSLMVAAVTCERVLPWAGDAYERARGAATDAAGRLDGHPATDGGYRASRHAGRTSGRAGRERDRRRGARIALEVVVVGATLVGGLYVGSALPNGHDGTVSQPAFVDEEDVTAMAWAGDHTAPNADFVVLGDAAEWFPLLSDRALLVGPWGAEWTTPSEYTRQLEGYEALSTCPTAACVAGGIADTGTPAPEYLYVPKSTYTVRGYTRTASPGLERSLTRASWTELAYENEGVLIYRVVDAPPSPDRVQPTTERAATRSPIIDPSARRL